MTGELRGRLRDELNAERPPPLGDLVATAVREGRRIRRQRRLAAWGGGAAVAGVVAFTVALGGPSGPFAPGIVPTVPGLAGPAAPAPGPAGRPVPGVHPAFSVAARPPLPPREQVRATPQAMLVLLEQLLPPGRTSAHAGTGQRDLHVQLYLDRGNGPGMIRVSVSGEPGAAPRPGIPAVTVDRLPDNCIQSTIVRARWPGGLSVQADLATCLAWDGRRNRPAPPALSADEARAVVADPRWGLMMDADLVKAGAREFPRLAYFG